MLLLLLFIYLLFALRNLKCYVVVFFLVIIEHLLYFCWVFPKFFNCKVTGFVYKMSIPTHSHIAHFTLIIPRLLSLQNNATILQYQCSLLILYFSERKPLRKNVSIDMTKPLFTFLLNTTAMAL